MVETGAFKAAATCAGLILNWSITMATSGLPPTSSVLFIMLAICALLYTGCAVLAAAGADVTTGGGTAMGAVPGAGVGVDTGADTGADAAGGVGAK